MKGLWLYIGSAVSVGGLVLGLSLSSAKGTSLSAAGSSTVFPLMAIMAETYPNANINVSAGGSGLGIQQISEDRIDIGNASKYPSFHDVAAAEDGWKNLRTFTIAEDALAMVTKLPANCSVNGTQLQAEWTDLYKTYSVKNSMTYSDLFTNTVQGSGCGAKITTLTRQNPSTSGTADIFTSYLAFNGDPKTATNPGDNKTPLMSADNANISTNESNAITLSQLEEINSGITYLSYGFYSENIANEKNIYPIAMKFNNQFVLPTKDTVESATATYDWVRPLNSIINLSNEAAYDFISWWIKGVTSTTPQDVDNIQHKVLSAAGYFISSKVIAQFDAQLTNRWVDDNDHSKGYKGDKLLNYFGVQVGDPKINSYGPVNPPQP